MTLFIQFAGDVKRQNGKRACGLILRANGRGSVTCGPRCAQSTMRRIVLAVHVVSVVKADGTRARIVLRLILAVDWGTATAIVLLLAVLALGTALQDVDDSCESISEDAWRTMV